MPEITIREIESLNHNVRRLTTDKPEGYGFEPGQATLVAVDKDGLREEKRPFTFTSLPEEEFLQFTIKIYPSHDGVTDEIDDLKVGDRLLIEDAWGAITFQGRGTFIAGGAGVTPFIAILRDQAKKQEGGAGRLVFSNRTERDLFLADELAAWTGPDLLLTFTKEEVEGAERGRVDEAFLKNHVPNLDQMFYVCGPPEMVDGVSEALQSLGVSEQNIVTEES